MNERPGHSVRVSQVVEAAPARVWDAFSRRDQLAQWFAPGDLKAEIHELDFRVGGRFDIAMVEPTGAPHRASGIFLEIVPRRRIVLSWRWVDFPPDPGESRVTFELHEDKAGTKVVITHEKLAGPESVRQHTEGWEGCLQNLVASVRGSRIPIPKEKDG